MNYVIEGEGTLVNEAGDEKALQNDLRGTEGV